jgi:hypothetical protein
MPLINYIDALRLHINHKRMQYGGGPSQGIYLYTKPQTIARLLVENISEVEKFHDRNIMLKLEYSCTMRAIMAKYRNATIDIKIELFKDDSTMFTNITEDQITITLNNDSGKIIQELVLVNTWWRKGLWENSNDDSSSSSSVYSTDEESVYDSSNNEYVDKKIGMKERNTKILTDVISQFLLKHNVQHICDFKGYSEGKYEFQKYGQLDYFIIHYTKDYLTKLGQEDIENELNVMRTKLTTMTENDIEKILSHYIRGYAFKQNILNANKVVNYTKDFLVKISQIGRDNAQDLTHEFLESITSLGIDETIFKQALKQGIQEYMFRPIAKKGIDNVINYAREYLERILRMDIDGEFLNDIDDYNIKTKYSIKEIQDIEAQYKENTFSIKEQLNECPNSSTPSRSPFDKHSSTP